MTKGATLASRTLVRRRTPFSLSSFDVPNPSRPRPSPLRWVTSLSPPRLPKYHPGSFCPSSLYQGPVHNIRWSFSTSAKAVHSRKGSAERQKKGEKWDKRRPKSRYRGGEASKATLETQKKSNHTTKSSESAQSLNDNISTAATLMENWEETAGISSSRQTDFRHFPGSSSLSRQPEEHAFKKKRFYETQQIFYKRLSDYRNVWYPSYVRSIDNPDVPIDWKTVLSFSHPPLTMVTWKMVVESEEMFRLLCSIHHDLFVVSASLVELPPVQSDLNSDDEQTPRLQDSAEPVISPQDLMCILLPFWEKMRKERTIIVNHYRPESSDIPHLSGSSSDIDTNGNGGWMSWFASAIDYVGGSKVSNTQLAVAAHEDIAFGPSQYHYNKLVGQLFFYSSPLVSSTETTSVLSTETTSEQEDIGAVDETTSSFISREQQVMLEKRVNMIQSLVDQSTSSGNLTSKIVRILIRAYAEVGTVESAQRAERAFNTYPKHQKNLLWYVLQGYMKVVVGEVRDFKKNPGDTTKKITPNAIFATQRICDLVATKHSTGYAEFQSCSLVAFQALSAMAPFSETFPGYFDRVHSLGVLKYGPKTWEALIQSKDHESGTAALRLDFHPLDHKTLSHLVLIYGEDEVYLGRAIRIVDVAFENFPRHELKRSFSHDTFHTLLNTLLKQQKRRITKESIPAKNANDGPTTNSQEVKPELDVAFRLVDKMMTEEAWFPVRQTFFHLFRLASMSGFDSDRVRTKLEVCRSQCSPPSDKIATGSALPLSYPLSPVKAAKFALTAWIVDAEKTGGVVSPSVPDPAERAWAILSSLRIASRPLFLPAEAVSDIYDMESAPDTSTYILVLKICSRVRSKKASEVTLKVLDIVEKEGLIMKGSICSTLVRAINNSLDMEHRVITTKRVYELATKDDKNLQKSIQRIFDHTFGYFRYRHPLLYEKHLADLIPIEEG